jgi:large subunit ribosomal protein L32e
MRVKRKGWPASPEIGYRSPKEIRNLHPSGFAEILIHRVEELQNVNPKTHAVRIAHTVGGRKRAGIVDEAKRLGFKVLNPGGLPRVESEKPEKTGS